MRNIVILIYIILSLPFLAMLIGCSYHTEIWSIMNEVEDLMKSNPDSALVMLSSVDKYNLRDGEEKARYALLMSMALDKNYIDTTSFDVLQPAIDYYPSNGTPDEKLRTWFYEGRIFQNRNDYDHAMQCFLKANDLKDFEDTLTFANMLIAQGNLYFQSYRIDDYISNNLKAAKLFEKIGNESYQQIGLIKALDGCVTLNYKEKADSILLMIEPLSKKIPEYQEIISSIKLMHKIKFGKKVDIKTLLDSISNLESWNDEVKLNMSLGYLNINEPQKAKQLFESIDSSGFIGQSIKYISIKPRILEANKQFEMAFAALNAFFIAIENENENISYQKTTVAEERYELELQSFYRLQRKNKQIWLGLCVVLLLVIIIGIIYYQLRIGKKNRIISEQEKSRLQLENDNLQNQNSVLELEKHNSHLELEKKNLAAENMKLKISQLESEKHNADLELEKEKLASENMRLKISQLESEGEHLKELLSEAKLSQPILDSIQERIGILNGLLAAKISDNEIYSKPYDKWINQITEDRKSFMDSTRLAFRASHPAFMKYLDEHGLTESELNYVCLYAIGLRGKEIGEYIQVKRHYHTSTDIRKKLGLKEDDTNLGLHIRNLMKKL